MAFMIDIWKIWWLEQEAENVNVRIEVKYFTHFFKIIMGIISIRWFRLAIWTYDGE